MVNFFDLNDLSRKGHTEIDLLVVQAERSATGDDHRVVVNG